MATNTERTLSSEASNRNVPLVVDLDGTLLRSDLLVETACALARQHPLQMFQLPVWLTQGKARLKARLATACSLNVAALPYDPDVIELIQKARDHGRTVVLATASHQMLAEQIAAHLQLFDLVLATNERHNLSSQTKCAELVSRFGYQGFDYAGNARADLPVWAAARRVIVVNPEPGVEACARANGSIDTLIRSNPVNFNDWLKAMRLHQWMKNLLILVPLLTAHQLDNPGMLLSGLMAFVSFGLCASSVYLLNDLFDLADDRQHPSKRTRPFAAGRLSVKHGALASPALLLLALSIAVLFLPLGFSLVLGIYYACTLAYSLTLKRHMVMDVITLAMLYTLRVIAGAAALALPLTFWILAFSMFMFLSLAMIKRYAELYDAQARGVVTQTPGRGYFPADMPMVGVLGAASGYQAIMVLALYINDQHTRSLYEYPELIWLACPLLLFWITRLWMLAHRGEMHDDPVLFALRDRISLWVGALFGLVFWSAA